MNLLKTKGFDHGVADDAVFVFVVVVASLVVYGAVIIAAPTVLMLIHQHCERSVDVDTYATPSRHLKPSCWL